VRETAFVLSFFALAAGISLGVAYVAEYDALHAGWVFMIQLGLASVVCEVLYFQALFVSLRANGEVPERWYERSFDHHHLLSLRQKVLVLPFFWAGALGLSVALLVSLVLAFAGLQSVV